MKDQRKDIAIIILVIVVMCLTAYHTIVHIQASEEIANQKASILADRQSTEELKTAWDQYVANHYRATETLSIDGQDPSTYVYTSQNRLPTYLAVGGAQYQVKIEKKSKTCLEIGAHLIEQTYAVEYQNNLKYSASPDAEYTIRIPENCTFSSNRSQHD